MWIGFLLVAACVVIGNPLLVMAIEYFNTGKIVESRWELPIPFASPYIDFASSPGFELTFIEFAITFIPEVYFAFSPSFLFLGICLYLDGMFLELSYRFRDINERRAFHEFRDCVEFQNEIYYLVENAGQVFGSSFFTQFINTILTVCLQAYLATQVGHDFSNRITYLNNYQMFNFPEQL